MKLLSSLIIGLAVLAAPAAVMAQTTPFPNAWGPSGQYNGTMDKRGNLYGPDGKFIGQVERPGAYARPGDDAYARGSTPRFHSTPRSQPSNQAVYGANGQYMGYVDRNGDLYDSKGLLKGRVR